MYDVLYREGGREGEGEGEVVREEGGREGAREREGEGETERGHTVQLIASRGCTCKVTETNIMRLESACIEQNTSVLLC